MKEKEEEKSSLTDYHRERNKKAVLAVEEMKKQTYTLEEMKEQTRQILSTVTPEDRGIVLEIGGEGGGIRIFRKRIKTKYVFIYQHNEVDFSGEDLSVNKTTKYDNFESAFHEIVNLYKFYYLYPLTVDVDYRDYVAEELINKLNLDNVSKSEFLNCYKFEEVLNIKLDFDLNEKKWKKQIDKIDLLIREAGDFQINENSSSYLIAYPHFINYFANITTDKIEIENLVIGIHFVYGWMPTIFEFKKKEIKEFIIATDILNKAKKGENLIHEDYQTLKELFNGSLVGTSKLLHFINPEKYAIWDSRVHNYLRKNIKKLKLSYKIGDISNYEKYLKYLTELTNSVEFGKIYIPVNKEVNDKYNYNISNFRAIELLMFQNGKESKENDNF
jgi:hypothetical protein